jgi:heterodisulfide reductase subunit A
VPEQHPPNVVIERGRATAVTAKDSLLDAQVSVPVDLVVLAVGLVPRADEAQRIQEMLKTPKGSDGFFLERHPELGPIETCVDGVFACGTAQGPKELRDALVQASAAAAKAAALLGSGRLFLDPAVCRVNADLCRGCGLCVSLCEFRAPGLTTDAAGIAVAAINPALCKGCGTCAVWCPTGAIEAQHFTDTQITSMIDSLFAAEARR